MVLKVFPWPFGLLFWVRFVGACGRKEMLGFSKERGRTRGVGFLLGRISMNRIEILFGVRSSKLCGWLIVSFPCSSVFFFLFSFTFLVM